MILILILCFNFALNIANAFIQSESIKEKTKQNNCIILFDQKVLTSLNISEINYTFDENECKFDQFFFIPFFPIYYLFICLFSSRPFICDGDNDDLCIYRNVPKNAPSDQNVNHENDVYCNIRLSDPIHNRIHRMPNHILWLHLVTTGRKNSIKLLTQNNIKIKLLLIRTWFYVTIDVIFV